MSFDDFHGSIGPDGQPVTDFVDVDVELDALFVAESDEAHPDDSELLARLESADTVACDVEARLDDILGTLDDLLTHLEQVADGDKSQETTIPSSESKTDPSSE